MKNCTLQRAIILASVLLICLIANYVKAVEKTPNKETDYLSVRESLIPMFVRGSISNEEFPFNRINPDIRQYILFYLDKDNQDYDFVANGIRLLGFVGSNEDIEFIDNYLQLHLKNIKNDEKFKLLSPNVALFSGAFAGIMIKRDIKGAEQFFQKYGQISVWISLEGTNNQFSGLSKICYSSFIMGAYQYSKADYILPLLKQKSSDSVPFVHESSVDALEKMEIDFYTKLMKPSPTPEKKLKGNINKYLEKYGEWIDRLLKKQTFADWRKEQEEQEKAAEVNHEKKPTESFESIDLTKTVEGENINAIAIQAVKAYQRLSLTGNEKSILIKDEFLQALKKAGLKSFDDFKVKVEFEAKINNILSSTNVIKNDSQKTSPEPNVVIDKIKANITFSIQGTTDMLKKYAPDTVHKSLLSKKTGDFNVVMIRTNDNWSWAPVVDSPVSADSNIVDDKYLIDSVNKAMIAYSQISQSIFDVNYDPLTIPLLDNGRLIPLEKRKKDKEEMTKALDMEKQILEDLNKNNLNNYVNYQMKVTFDAALDNGTLNIETGTMPKDVKGYETADLTFMIRNGAEAYKAHTTSRNDQRCIDAAGNLKVTMKRINGTWYWNPFGW
jgi:hypothetical protein